jgi:hypothetical protein
MQEQLDCLVGNWELQDDQIIIGDRTSKVDRPSI